MTFTISKVFEGDLKKHLDVGLLETQTRDGTRFCINDTIFMSHDGALIDMKNKKILHNFDCKSDTNERYTYHNIKEKNGHWIFSNSAYCGYFKVIKTHKNIYVFEPYRSIGNPTSLKYNIIQVNNENKINILNKEIKLCNAHLFNPNKPQLYRKIYMNADYDFLFISNEEQTSIFSLETTEKIEDFKNYDCFVPGNCNYSNNNHTFSKIPYHLLPLNNIKGNKSIIYNLKTRKIELELKFYIHSFCNMPICPNCEFYNCIRTNKETFIFEIDNKPSRKTELQELTEKYDLLKKKIENENKKLKQALSERDVALSERDVLKNKISELERELKSKWF